jgi:hypothetical protein
MMHAIDALIDKESRNAIMAKTDAREYVYAKIVAAGVGILTDFGSAPNANRRK